MSKAVCLSLCVLCGLHLGTLAGPPVKLPVVSPETVQMLPERLAVIDRLVEEGLEKKRMPGAVVVVGRQGKIVHQKAYGYRQLVPEKLPMTVDTVFDLASLTKPIATATSIMLLVEQGKIDLEEPVATYLPAFGQAGKEPITVHQLLTHQSGMIADNSLSDYADGPATAWRRICELKPLASPKERFIYSDVNFIILGELIKQVTGQSVHEFSQAAIFRPLGMSETGFLPNEALQHRSAATQQRDNRWLKGEVHDPRAARLGGVAGHAGLFSTANDLAVYAQMIIEGGRSQNARILQGQTVKQMTNAYPVPGGFRGLGWDKNSAYSSNRGDLFSDSAIGHGGFTGTGIWIDPEQELFVIFLSNRVHPDGRGLVNPLIGRIGTVAAAAIGVPPSKPMTP